MKATGVVRRIDDLGRIVIPKEIRRSFKINEGDSLEIFVDENGIILKKYSVLDNMLELSEKLVDVFKNSFGKSIIITDKERVIAASKDLKKEYLNKELTCDIKETLDNRSEFSSNNPIIENSCFDSNYFLVPIIANSDILGSVILISDDISDYDKSLIRFINLILIKNIEQ